MKHGVPSAADGGFGSAAYERQKSNEQRDQFARVDCSLLQTTYIPAGEFALFGGLLATGQNSTVYLGVIPGASFTVSQTGPFPAADLGTAVLLRLSLNTKSPIFPLACVGNAASYRIGSIAPGELGILGLQ